MAKVTITHHPKRKCISFTYDGCHQWNIFDVEEGSGTLELFGRLQYALEKNFDITLNVEKEEQNDQ